MRRGRTTEDEKVIELR